MVFFNFSDEDADHGLLEASYFVDSFEAEENLAHLLLLTVAEVMLVLADPLVLKSLLTGQSSV